MLGSFGGGGKRASKPRKRTIPVMVDGSTGAVHTLPRFGLLEPVEYSKKDGVAGGHANLSVHASFGAIAVATQLDQGSSQTINGIAKGADECAVSWSAVLTRPVGQPAAPSLILTPGSQQVSIAFSDGATGGSPIDYHRLFVSNAPGVTTADWAGDIHTGSPFMLSPLVDGTPVYARISAVNQAGFESELSIERTATPSSALLVKPLISVDHIAKTATLSNPVSGASYSLYSVDATGAETLVSTMNAGNSYTANVTTTKGKHFVCRGTKPGYGPTVSGGYILSTRTVVLARDYTNAPDNSSLSAADPGTWVSTTGCLIEGGALKSAVPGSANYQLPAGVTRVGLRMTKCFGTDANALRMRLQLMSDTNGWNHVECQFYNTSFLIKKTKNNVSLGSTSSVFWKSPTGTNIIPTADAVTELEIKQTGPSTWFMQMYLNGVPCITTNPAGYDVSDIMAAPPGTRVHFGHDGGGATPPDRLLTKFEIIDYTAAQPFAVTSTTFVPATTQAFPKLQFSGVCPSGTTTMQAALRDWAGNMLTPWVDYAVSGGAFTNLSIDLISAAQSITPILVMRDKAASATVWETQIGMTPAGREYVKPQIGMNMPFNEITDAYRKPTTNRWSWQSNTIGRGDYNNGVNPPGYDFSGPTQLEWWEPTSAINQTVFGAARKMPSPGLLYCTLNASGAGNELPAGRGGMYEIRFVDPLNPADTAQGISWTYPIAGTRGVSNEIAPVNGVGYVTLAEDVVAWKVFLAVTAPGGFPAHGRGIVPLMTKVTNTVTKATDTSPMVSTDTFQSDIHGATTANGPIRWMNNRRVNKSKVIPMNDPKGMLDVSNRWRGGGACQPCIETAIAVSNECDRPLWWNIPHHDSDEHITEELTIARDTLNKKLYLEWSNETWNQNFDQYSQVTYLGCVKGLYNLAGDKGVNNNIIYAARGNGLIVNGGGATARDILKSDGFQPDDMVFVEISGIGWVLYKCLNAVAAGSKMPNGVGDDNWLLVANHAETQRAGKRYKAERNIRIRELATAVYGATMNDRFELITGAMHALGASFIMDELIWKNSFLAVDQVATAPYWQTVGSKDLGGWGSANDTPGWTQTEKALYTNADLTAFGNAFFSSTVAPAAVEQMIAGTVTYADNLEQLLRAVPGYTKNKIKLAIYESGWHVLFTQWPDMTKANIAYDYLQNHPRMKDMYQDYYTGLAQRLGGIICVFDFASPTAAQINSQYMAARWGIMNKTGNTTHPMYQGVAAAVATAALI